MAPILGFLNAGGFFYSEFLTHCVNGVGVAGCIIESQFDSIVRRDFITARIFGLNEHFLTLPGI
jgi:hypothetical protein